MRKLVPLLTTFWFGTLTFPSYAQEGKFEQLDLPTPNEYRSGSGAPGHQYWQQRADYTIEVTLNDEDQSIEGTEQITYYNNSPDPLTYLWVQLDQNLRAPDSNTPLTNPSALKDSLSAGMLQVRVLNDEELDGGFQIKSVQDEQGGELPYIINKTMMKVSLPEPLRPNEQLTFGIEWSYYINDRMIDHGRSGYEYFPEDDNYLYTIAQFYPRMAVYDDVNGWQNKQFLGAGEFALTFGTFDVSITVPEDHVVGATGVLQNPKTVLSSEQRDRLKQARQTFDQPVMIVTEEEAQANEQTKASGQKTWMYHADSVRDFAFASSRKFIWDAMAVQVNRFQPLAMSFYPKEGNPLWEEQSTLAVKNTLENYSKRTFDYPYPVAISVHAASIGMEYPMICFNFGRPEPDGTYTDNTKWNMIGVIVHEVGHNFFPMIVNSDERQWTWMDEGLNTFLETLTLQEYYPTMPVRFGTPATITDYMKGDPENIRPIMTNSEQILQFGNNAYGKPSAALMLLRNTIIGPALFDASFKEYAQRWAFKHPTPADFFRTMEDASAVDLDWFWRGWFYTTDHVDVNVANVKRYRLSNPEATVESRVKAKKEDIGGRAKKEEKATATGLNTYEELTVIDTQDKLYGEFRNRLDDTAIRQKYADKDLYEVTFENKGGLVTPLIVEFSYADGSTETEQLPAEIWRKSEREVTKVFAKDKEVVKVRLDPRLETADANPDDNVFPREPGATEFEKFKRKKKSD